MSAKEQIKKLFRESEVLYFSDISDKLNMDIESVVDICRELHKEGFIHVAE